MHPRKSNEKLETANSLGKDSSRLPTHAHAADHVKQRQVTQADGALELERSGHAGRSIAEIGSKANEFDFFCPSVRR